jgi:hypothetical protein
MLSARESPTMSEPSHQIRIRLEGRLEILETAIPRYEALLSLLRGNWQRRAIEEREAVHRFLSDEPSLDAALDHAHRVAQRDGWPPEAEARQVTARIDALRSELQARLEKPSWQAAAKHLREMADSARLPGPEELVLLEGTAARTMPLWALTLAPTLLALSTYGGLAAAGVMVSMVCFGLAVLPLGRYVLLVDRLVWIPYRGVPIELPLATLKPNGVTLARRNIGISLEGASASLLLPVVTSPVQLAALLLLYRDGPLKGVDRPPAGTVVILPAWLARSGPDLEGFVLLHSGGMCFLPKGTAPALLKKITGSAPLELPISETFLLEQLTRLPPAALHSVLGVAAEVPGGLYALAEDITTDPGARSGQKLRLRTAGSLVEIPIGAVDYEALRTLFPWTQDTTRHVP